MKKFFSIDHGWGGVIILALAIALFVWLYRGLQIISDEATIMESTAPLQHHDVTLKFRH